MELAPSRLHHVPTSEVFSMRSFQPPADTRFYAGVDLHARTLFTYVLDHRRRPEGVPRRHPPVPQGRGRRLRVHVRLVRSGRPVRREGIPFALGHALAMKHIH